MFKTPQDRQVTQKHKK